MEDRIGGWRMAGCELLVRHGGMSGTSCQAEPAKPRNGLRTMARDVGNTDSENVEIAGINEVRRERCEGRFGKTGSGLWSVPSRHADDTSRENKRIQ